MRPYIPRSKKLISCLVIFALFIGINFSIFAHPLHFAVLNVDYNSSGLLSLSITTDCKDVDNILKNMSYSSGSVCDETKFKNFDKQFVEYLRKSVVLSVDLNLIKLELINFAEEKIKDGKATYVFKFQTLKNAKKIMAKCTFLTDIYPEQKNLLVIHTDNIEKGFNLDQKNTIAELNLNQF